MPTLQAKLIAAAAIFALLSGIFGWLMVSRANLKTDLATSRANFDLCQAANDDWKAKTDLANAAIAKMREEAKAREVAAKEAQKQAASASLAHGSHADRLLALKPSGEACIAAHGLLTTYLRGKK